MDPVLALDVGETDLNKQTELDKGHTSGEGLDS